MWMLVSVFALVAATSAARAETATMHTSLLDRLRDAARPPVVLADLECNRGYEKSCKKVAQDRGNGWTCQYVPEWRQWCLIPPGK